MALKKFRASAKLPENDDLDAQALSSMALSLAEKAPSNSEALSLAVQLVAVSESLPRSQSIVRQSGTWPTTGLIESYIVSEFDGLELGNIYKLANGQVWEQTEAWIWVWVWINPKVLIWNDGGVSRMKVEGIEHPVMVQRIK